MRVYLRFCFVCTVLFTTVDPVFLVFVFASARVGQIPVLVHTASSALIRDSRFQMDMARVIFWFPDRSGLLRVIRWYEVD